MEQRLTQQHLSVAERHVASGEWCVVRQSALLARLERQGRETKAARALLALFEQVQAAFVADRDRLLMERAKGSGQQGWPGLSVNRGGHP